MAREQTKMITSIGGQALMEGVMMRGPKKTSVAVRLPDETIDVEELKIKSLRERYKWLNWPFIRGVIAMYESMTIGFKALGMSADKSLPEDEEEAEPSKFDQWMTRVFGENAMNYLMVIAGTLGVLIAIGLFFFLPALSFNLIYNYTGIGDGFLPGALHSTKKLKPSSMTNQSGAPTRPAHSTFRHSPPAFATVSRSASTTRPSGVIIDLLSRSLLYGSARPPSLCRKSFGYKPLYLSAA